MLLALTIGTYAVLLLVVVALCKSARHGDEASQAYYDKESQ